MVVKSSAIVKPYLCRSIVYELSKCMSRFVDETDLWLRLRRADIAAFEALYTQYWCPLFLYTYKVLNDKEEAKDILQLFFIDLWEKAQQLPPVTNIRSYLYKGLKNRILNSIRDQQIEKKHVTIFYEVSDCDEGSFDEVIDSPTFKRHIDPLIDTLPLRMQQVLQMHYLEDLSVYQIAEQLGTAPQTIRNQLNIALKRIRNKVTVI